MARVCENCSYNTCARCVFMHVHAFRNILRLIFTTSSLQVSTSVTLYLNNNSARMVIDLSHGKQDNDCAWKWSVLQVKAPSGKQAEDLCPGVPCLTGWQGRRMARPISASILGCDRWTLRKMTVSSFILGRAAWRKVACFSVRTVT